MKSIITNSIKSLAILLLAVSCSPYVLKSGRVLNNADLTTYKSFTIQPVEIMKLPKGFRVRDDQSLYKAVAAELKSRGYTEVEQGADMVVQLTITTKKSVEKDINSTNIRLNRAMNINNRGVNGAIRGPVGVGVGVGVGTINTTATTEIVTDGVITMDLKSSASGDYLYSSTMSARIDMENIVLKDRAELAKAIGVLFKKYPIKVDK